MRVMTGCIVCGSPLGFSIPERGDNSVLAPLCLACLDQRLVERAGLALSLRRPPVGSLFPLGRVLLTREALAALASSGEDAVSFLGRHSGGDFGAAGTFGDSESAGSDQDRLAGPADDTAALNAAAIIRWGGRVFSAYTTDRGRPLWVVTDFRRRMAVTTVLSPDED
jgi:hypothetical protein